MTHRARAVLLFAALAGACATACPAAGLPLPEDAGYVDIRRYGAAGDGARDDTQAFARAVADEVRGLYLPAGTYLVSDPIVLGGKRWTLQGAGRDATVIRLRDHAPGFGDPTVPRPVVSTFAPFMAADAAMNTAFRNALYDLTIDVGAGNPGAIALHYLGNNQGTVRAVTLRSSDPERRGRAGLALVTNWPGPALFEALHIEGFDVGVWSTRSQYGLVFDRLVLRDQRVAGIDNTAQVLTIRRLDSENRVPALRSRGAGAFVTLLDSALRGGAPGAPAVESSDGAALLVARLRTEGYGTAIRTAGGGDRGGARGPAVAWFSSHPGHAPAAAAAMLDAAAIPDPPDPPLPPIAQWANVRDFGALPADDAAAPDAAPAIQAAIDSGAPLVYLPRGTYAIGAPVVVRGSVQRLLGMDSRIRGLTGAQPIWRIGDGAAPGVILERLDLDYASTSTLAIEHATRRPLVVRQATLHGYRNTVPGGRVFLDDVCGTSWRFQGQTVWARQLNPEAMAAPAFNVEADGSRLWLFGVKTEGPQAAVRATASQVELWGGFFYASRGVQSDTAAIELRGGSLLGSWVNHRGDANRPGALFAPQLRVWADGRITELHLASGSDTRAVVVAPARD